jgi:RNA polymerase sigma-70 factor (ECF subfamily)
MARHAAVQRRRGEQKLPPLARSQPDPLQKSFAWLPRSEEIARLEERRDLLRKVVNQLPKPQRHALELAVFEGHPEAEIAAKLGEPLGRVRAVLRAGMRFLRHRQRAVLGTWAVNI